MVLRKDKVAAALREMRGMCSDPTAPNALPEVMGQLTNILGDLFDDIALPALGDLPGIDTGQDELPEEEEEELDVPVGGGSPGDRDFLDGFEEPPPGGGDDQGGGGDGGGCNFAETEERHCTFLATAKTEISAADESGNPGTGTVTIMVVEEMNPEQKEKCREECKKDHQKDLDEASERIRKIRFATEQDLPTEGWDHSELGGSRSAALKIWQDKKQAIWDLITNCYLECGRAPNPEGPQEAGCEAEAQNISCEKIEKGTTVVVSGTMEYDIYTLPNGEICGEECVSGTENLYVIVEACGCD